MIHPTGPENARIMIVGEFPSEDDLRKDQPLASFDFMKMLQEANLFKQSCFVTLVNRTRAPQGRTEGLIATRKKDITHAHVLYNGKHVLPSVVDGIAQLKHEIELVKPNVILAVGNLALWALTGEWGVNNWRSSIMESTLVPKQKVIPSLAPGVINAQWKWRPLLVHDIKRVVKESAFPEIHRPDYKFIIRPTFENAVNNLKWLLAQVTANPEFDLSTDIETRAGHISCIAMAWSPVDAICIPLMCVHNPEGYWTLEEETELVRLMCLILSRAHNIGQNFNYDAQYLYRHWFWLPKRPVEDTMIMQHSCFSNMEKNLAFLSSMYCEDHLYWKDDRTNWKDSEGEDTYWIYNCTDAVRTFSIAHVLRNVVSAMGLDSVNEFQQNLALPVLKTMNRGIRMDTEARDKFALQLLDEIDARECWMQNVIGHPLNIKSPKQMKEFFYDELGQKEIFNSKTKTITCNDEALHTLARREPILLPLTRKISELRSLGVFYSTFVQAPLDVDGRIRTSFNICGTDTYRFASSKNAFGTGLNCQNIPNGGELEEDGLELPNVRKLFIPDPGHTFFDIDLDSADLRIVTWESDCKWMKDHFRNGRKPYVEVMKEYYHDQNMSKKSHPREYAMFKALCHGTNYLGTADGIAPRIGLLVHETERIQKWYFGMCPEIRKWQDDLKKQILGRRYIQNVFGYRRYFFDRIEGTVFNQGVAWIPQSSVGCLINRAYVNIDRNLPEVEILLQVHDSLGGQFNSIHGDWALRRIIEESQITLPYSDPLIIPVGIKSSTKSWGDCE